MFVFVTSLMNSLSNTDSMPSNGCFYSESSLFDYRQFTAWNRNVLQELALTSKRMGNNYTSKNIHFKGKYTCFLFHKWINRPNNDSSDLILINRSSLNVCSLLKKIGEVKEKNCMNSQNNSWNQHEVERKLKILWRVLKGITKFKIH